MKAMWLLRGAAMALLVAWAVGLLFAAVKLREWDRSLVQTMLQVRADRTFRVRMAQRHEAIPREWYRAKALALLKAGDELQDDSDWSRFVPGAWAPVDALRERVAQRIEREFSEIAVQTIRRELEFRAGQLAGVPRDGASGELLAQRGCADPVLAASHYEPGAPARSLAELEAVHSHLGAIEELDHAVQALAALQSPDPARAAAALQELVRYTLGAQLPGQLSRSAALLRQVLQPSDPALAPIPVAGLRQAVRCSLGKRMAALDARVYERNDLLAVETALAPHLARLQAAGGAARPLAETLAQWQQVVALIGAQLQLLGDGANGWMYGRGDLLGPLHEAVLARAERVALLGPQAARDLRRRSARSLAHLQRLVRSQLASGRDPALLWREGEDRLVLSPDRIVLREQLAQLLQEPFMAPVPAHALPDQPAGALAWDAQALAQALDVGHLRRRFAAEQLPRFPARVRIGVARVVDRQLAQQVQAAVAQALRAAAPVVPDGIELASWRKERQQAARVQALLAQLGDGVAAERLRGLLAGDVAARLAPADDALAQSPFFAARLQDFGWWGGDGSPVLHAFGVLDALTLRHVLAQEVGALDALRGRVAPLLRELPAAGADAATARWQGIAADLDRYRARRTDSSLLVFERGLMALAADFDGANCSARLAAAPTPRVADDAFAQRHRRVFEALAHRCGVLRARPPVAPPAPVIPLA